MPIEVVTIGNVPAGRVRQALSLANAAQPCFLFTDLSDEDAGRFRMHAFRNAVAKEALNRMEGLRSELRGYHPFLIAIMDAYLEGAKYGNLFGSHRPEKGLALVTTANVPDIIIPADRLHAYLIYYLARYTLSFLVPEHRSHEDSRGCVFDQKVEKADLLRSMKARALCDICRDALLATGFRMSHQQFDALESMFRIAGEEVRATTSGTKPRVFVGSSSEGLGIANKVQELLTPEVTAVVWNEGTVFGLGSATLESLEKAVLDYDFAIFVFTPDDELHTRGVAKPVARDNVVFELGLFTGKLGRKRSFVLNPGKGAVALPSDLLGIATATYDATESNSATSLAPACTRMRDAIRTEWAKRV